VTINVYPSTLPGEPIERHAHEGTLHDWMTASVPGYTPGPVQPVWVDVDGVAVPPEDWKKLECCCAQINIRIRAGGGAFSFLSGIVDTLFGWLVRVPKTRQQAERKEIKMADARANIARLGDVIPEIAGHYRRYPDYLVPPHRYFVNEREQWVELLLCIGKGEYEIAPSSIRVGDTPLISLGDGAEFRVYGPGEHVGANSSAVWWHSAPEVGGSGMGKAGLELTQTFEVDRNPTATSFQFDGLDITVPVGAGEFPEGWTAGMIVRVEQTRSYTVTDGGLSADTIEGELAQLEPFVGMKIEIVGDNAGNYEVESYTPGSPDEMTLKHADGSPVTSLTTGLRRMAIGYRRMRYRLTAASTTVLSVERLTDTGATDTWVGWDFLETSDAVITLDPSTSEGDWSGPFAACPAGEVTGQIEVDFILPSGLTNISDQGKVRDHNVTVEVQWRDIATAEDWTSTEFFIEHATLDALGYTFTIPVNDVRPEVRCRVLEASDSTKIQDTVQWFGLRAQLDAPGHYAGVTTMTARIRGGDRLAAQAENLVSVECTRILPTMSAEAFGSPQPTRAISAWVRHVANSIGYTDAQLDLAELQRLDKIWAARGDTFDFVQDETTVRDAINLALRAGFAEMTVSGGLIRPVRDELRTEFEETYSPQNMTGPLKRSFEAIRPDDQDGVDVEFMDERTWSKVVMECRLPGDAGVRVEKITLDGVIDATRAWRIGMRARRGTRYRRWSYEWETELDALNSRYLSYVPVLDDVPGYGKSSILIGSSVETLGTRLVVSEPMDWTVAGDNLVAVRMPNGTVSGPYVAMRGEDDYEIIAVGMGTALNVSVQMEPPHVSFGSVERWSFPVLVTEIDPNGFQTVGVKGINYDARVYADDDNVPN